MHRGLEGPLVLLVCALLTACSGASLAPVPTAVPAAAPTPAPTVPPTTTPLPTFAKHDRIAGVDVAGQSVVAARSALEQQLQPLLERSLKLRAGEHTLLLSARAIDLELPLDQLLEQAEHQLAAAKPVRVPLQISYDQAAVRTQVERFAAKLAEGQPAESALVVSSTEELSRSFFYQPAYRIDVDAALKQIDKQLKSPQGGRTLTLTPVELPLAAGRDLDLLREQIAAMAEEWNGVVGFYLYDLESGQEIGLHEHSVFSGASVMKVPIMIQTFISIPEFDEDEQFWLEKMIVESDNKAANALMARIAGGGGTEVAFEGIQQVNQTLRELGLPFTYQSLPYEAGDYLINVLGKKIYRGPALDGPEPQTEADPYLRTTPLEMGRLMTMLVQCSRSEGSLLERYKEELSAARCQEMVERLQRNGDKIRMVAGVPEGTSVAHKSGWVEDMQADVGYVETPGGDYVVAIYVYRQIVPGKNFLADEIAAPVIASFSRLTYSFYNPQRLDAPAGSD